MAKGNLSNCLDVTLPHEGGYSDHPADPGGATNMGITIGVLSDERGYAVSKAEVKALTLSEAKAIYAKRYWSPLNAEGLPFGLDCATFDAGVNSGIRRGAKWLQAAVGVNADGVIGPATLAAAAKVDVKAAIQALCAARLGFMQSLKIWQTFKRGWSARVADVEAKSVAMWLKFGSAMSPAQQQAQLDNEADAATGRARAQGKAAGGVTAGGGLGGGSVVATTPDLNLWIVGGVTLAVVVIVAALVVQSMRNRERAAAYLRAANSVG